MRRYVRYRPVSEVPPMANEAKLRELILYIAKRMEDDRHKGRGRIKLAKFLFFSDFEAFTRLGATITGSRYWADDLGPSPVDEMLASRALEEDGDLSWESGYQQQKLPIAHREARIGGLLSEAEIAIVDEQLGQHRLSSANHMVDIAHKHPAYVAAQFHEDIPNFTALLSPRQAPDDAVEIGKQLIREHRWDPEWP
jgi:hypothetical protein